MREIKFRGLSICFSDCSENEKWIYGDLCIYNEGKIYSIRDRETNLIVGTLVFPGSVGQYTGIKDKEGTEVYEGDIVKIDDYDTEYEIFYYGGSLMIRPLSKIIKESCEKEHESFLSTTLYYRFKNMVEITGFEFGDNVKVIGNIHENSDLIKERGRK